MAACSRQARKTAGSQGLGGHGYRQLWQLSVRHWFAKLQSRAYFIPPVYMNRQHISEKKCGSMTVHMLAQPVDNQPKGQAGKALQTAHVRDDRTQQRVLFCLQELVKNRDEVMVVLSQLQFGDYLNKPAFAAAASAHPRLPRPVDLKTHNKHEGDFDMIIIHRLYGLLVLEIKAMGDNFTDLGLSPDDQDCKVSAKVLEALKQLKKAVDVMNHLVSDLPVKLGSKGKRPRQARHEQRPPRVRSALVLPNISKQQLERVLVKYPETRKALCECVGSLGVPLCVCEDQLSRSDNPFDVNTGVLDNLGRWFDARMTSGGPDPAMDESSYEELVMRFCGPATTVRVFCPRRDKKYVELRSEGEGAWETGDRFSRVVLLPRHVAVLQAPPPRAYVTGPPGTGKTVMLYLKALQWIQEGGQVIVFSTCKSSLAASHMLVHMINSWLEDREHHYEELKQNVSFRHFDLDHGDLDKACASLLGFVRNHRLFVVADEVPSSSDFRVLCQTLYKEVPALCLWAASTYHKDNPDPLILEELVFREPLRTPPVITREVEQAGVMREWESVYRYKEPEAPLPTVGPSVKHLSHAGHEAEVYDCEQCGKNVADVLKELHVGHKGSPLEHLEHLMYRDVFVLTREQEFHKPVKGAHGHMTQEVCGFIQALQREGIPVRIIPHGDSEAARDLALMAGDDEVGAASMNSVTGLERKVVVWLEGNKTWDENAGRLLIASRCMAQLIHVSDPHSPDADSDG